MAYLHGISQLPGYPRYNGDIITSCTCLQLIPIDNNKILRSEELMVDFQGMHFNAKKALYINFHNHAAMFCKAMLSKTNGRGPGRCYVLLKSMCDTKNNDFPIEDRYSDIIC